MAMNFKIFNDKETLSVYVADLLRKQVHNNPNSVMALQNHADLHWAYEKFVGEAKQHPADFSQVYINTVNDEGDIDVLNKLPIPDDQLNLGGDSNTLINVMKNKKRIHLSLLYISDDGSVGFENSTGNENLYDSRELIVVATGSDKAGEIRKLYDAAENDGDDYSNIKTHRIVTIVLDKDAASNLDDDIADYYSHQFA